MDTTYYTSHIVYDNEPVTFSTTINWLKKRQKKKPQNGTKIVNKIKRYRDKMKTRYTRIWENEEEKKQNEREN